MLKDELRVKVKKAKILIESFLVFWFLLWAGVAYLLIDYLNSRLEGNYRILFIPIFIAWLVCWVVLFLVSARIINKKLGFICPHCDMVCYGNKKNGPDIKKGNFLLTGKCNRCQGIIFEISDN